MRITTEDVFENKLKMYVPIKSMKISRHKTLDNNDNKNRILNIKTNLEK